MGKKLNPVHPGRILRLDFMEPYGLTQYRLAKGLGVPPVRINGIVHEKRSITPDTALRLSRYFGNTAQFWMNLQTHFDLQVAQSEKGNLIEQQVKPVDRETLRIA